MNIFCVPHGDISDIALDTIEKKPLPFKVLTVGLYTFRIFCHSISVLSIIILSNN